MGRGAPRYQPSLCWEHARGIRVTRWMRPTAPRRGVVTGSGGNGEIGVGDGYDDAAVSLRELDRR